MRRGVKALTLAVVFMCMMSAGAMPALAAETEQTEAQGQTEQTETQGQTEVQPGQTEAQPGQTEAQPGQTEAQTPQTETQPTPAWPVFTEPSGKQGLQSEGQYRVFYDGGGYLQTGWQTVGGETYYFRPDALEGPRGSALTGFQTISAGVYYFDGAGVLQTGWQTIDGSRYYFAPTGAPGALGRMYVGVNKIDGKTYGFDESGSMRVGLATYGDKTYFFNKKTTSESYGVACTGWKTISGAKYYFGSNGVMKKSRWINKKYYVGANGKMLKNGVTPDGYYVDSKGVRGKRANGLVKVGKKVYYFDHGEMAVGVKKISGRLYYFKPNGVRKNSGMVTVGTKKYLIKDGVVQTGWAVYNGKRYYFNKNGRMVTNKVVDGIQLGEDGATFLSVLILSGHGQGDSGATATYGSTTYREENLTREFASLVYKKMQKLTPGIKVTLYDQNYDCYQVLSGQKSGPKPDFKMYDYVLEVHFNATVASGKDPNGDGSCKGVGMYVNSAKKDTTIDRKIIAAVSEASGLPIWGRGSGIFLSSGLFNARTLQAMGVSYGLLETAFIDDKDDMRVYNSKKEDMAEAVATAIGGYYGLN